MNIVKNQTKVFFIGFHKTGTGYYNSIFNKLGYRVLHHWKWRRGNRSVIDRYDIFLDGCLHDYARLHHLYPGAKFILNTRRLDHWLLSRMKFFHQRYTNYPHWLLRIMNPVFRAIWGNDCFFDQRMIQNWIVERHDYHQAVQSFFSELDTPLLVVDIDDNAKLDKIARFLNVPTEQFSAFDPGSRENMSASNDKQLLIYKEWIHQAISTLGLSEDHLERII